MTTASMLDATISTDRAEQADLPDLCTVADVCDWTGLTPNAIYVRQSRGTMPAPDGRLGATPFWLRETVQTWAPNGVIQRRTRSDKGTRRTCSCAPA